jgi:hypothetical protein
LSAVTAKARVQSQRFNGGICGGQSPTGAGFSAITSISPANYHSITAPLSHLSLGTGTIRPFMAAVLRDAVMLYLKDYIKIRFGKQDKRKLMHDSQYYEQHKE